MEPRSDAARVYVRNATLLIILSIQVGIQPLLMKWYAKDTNSIALRVAVIELMKFVIAMSFLFSDGKLGQELLNWSFTLAAKTTLAPSLIYVVQNYLNQKAVVILDGVTFNILNQTKIIWTAILVFIMLGKRQSFPQIGALLLLLISAVVMTTNANSGKSGTMTSSWSSMDPILFTGITQALMAAVLSGLAGTIVQKALQTQQRNPYMVTIELCTFGIGSLILSEMFSGATGSSEESVWKGWSFMTFVAMFSQAVGGVVIGFVIKYTGNVEKSFAVVAGLAITALLESVFNGQPFGIRGFFSVALVAISTYIYTKYPYQVPPIPQAHSPNKRTVKSP